MLPGTVSSTEQLPTPYTAVFLDPVMSRVNVKSKVPVSVITTVRCSADLTLDYFRDGCFWWHKMKSGIGLINGL